MVRFGVLVVSLALVAAGCAGGDPGGAAPPAVVSTEGGTTPSADAPVDGIGPDLVLPEERGEDVLAEYTDWQTDDAVGQAWLLDPCRPTEYPTDRERTSFRATGRTGPEFHDARQLATYPTPELAAEAVAGFRRALGACSTGTTPAGITWQWTFADVPDLGDEGIVAASTFGAGQQSPSGDRVAVTRVGAAVFLAYGGGEFGTAELDGGADEMRRLAGRFAELLRE